MRFLAIGECMAELAPAEVPGALRLGFAGDTYNTAWYLGRLLPKAEVAYLSAVGDDDVSRQMLAAMDGAGIDTSHVARVPGRTVGLYLIALKDGERSFSYWRGQSAARSLAADEGALARALGWAETIYISGITLAILERDGRRALIDALAGARAGGRTVVFDPNLRPRLWTSASEMSAEVMVGAGVADIVLPSFEDEARAFGDADPDATLARYRKAGARTVVVKDGPGPVRFEGDGTRGEVPVPPVTGIVDTTAAGDSFNAALLAALDLGRPLPDAISAAARVAGQVVRGQGALVPVDPLLLDA